MGLTRSKLRHYYFKSLLLAAAAACLRQTVYCIINSVEALSHETQSCPGLTLSFMQLYVENRIKNGDSKSNHTYAKNPRVPNLGTRTHSIYRFLLQDYINLVVDIRIALDRTRMCVRLNLTPGGYLSARSACLLIVTILLGSTYACAATIRVCTLCLS